MIVCRISRWLCLALVLVGRLSVCAAEDAPPIAQEVGRFDAPEAIQGVAVDADYFYAIDNSTIGKYDKHSGQFVKRWTASPDVPLTHLDSGIVIDGKLYCANSNFPQYPDASSIEIWDPAIMEHIDSHSLGIDEGSLTWIDWHDDAWWAVFAHYTKKVNDDPHARDARWTSLVRFDREWRRTAGWTFPAEVIERFEPHSCSGGSWGSDGFLYCSGHDRGELYKLALPRGGPVLQLVSTIEVPFTGQGFAFDRSEPDVIYGIDRRKQQVVVVKLGTAHAVASAAAGAPAN